MPDPQQRFRDLLDELFQFNRADLDFGIYRIMNQKRDEIARFLDNDLLPQIQKTLGTYQQTTRRNKEAELRHTEIKLQEAGIAYDAFGTSERYRDLCAELDAIPNARAVENEVLSDLYTFFRRYYQEGDFISQRRYKAGVYAIPYEGEEVKLHWANADQYYVKTSENFQDYRFSLRDGRYVHFRLVAAETERDNNKPASGKDRRFVLDAADPVEVVDGELHIRFTY